ncbi:MAG TPA: hypothetical protein VI111_11150 [Thermoleophilaceae bacterium]
MPVPLDLLEHTTVDRNSRAELVAPVQAIRWDGPVTDLLPPGSGVFLYGPASSKTLGALVERLNARDADGVDEVIGGVRKQAASAPLLSEREALDKLFEAPAYADLRYRGKTLVTNAFTTSDIDYARVVFPYAGGDVELEEFSVAEFVQADGFEGDDRVGPTVSVVVLHEPTLSDVERELLAQVPAESDEIVLGTAGIKMSGTPGALVATVTAGLLVATVGTALGHCSDLFRGKETIVLPAELSSNAAIGVKQLVEARREALTAR